MLTRSAVFAVSLLFALQGAQAQEELVPPPVEERVGRERQSPRLVIVIDVSGSMQGIKIDMAIREAVDLALVGIDDLEVGVIVFNHDWRKVAGPTGPGSFWYRLPDAPNAELFRRAVSNLTVNENSTTDPAFAIYAALMLGAQSVVLITDGLFMAAPTISEIWAARDTLEEKGSSLPRVSIIGILKQDKEVALLTLQRVASAAGGQVFVRDIPDEDEEALIPFPPVDPNQVWPH